MLGCQALDFKKGKKPGKGILAAYELIRTQIPFIKTDSILYQYVEKIFQLLKNEKLVKAVENSIGQLEEPEDLPNPL